MSEKTVWKVKPGTSRSGGHSAIVYSHKNEEGAIDHPKAQLSALVVTREGTVYGAGVNNLVAGHDSVIPMKVGMGGSLQDFEAIHQLKYIEKLVVGRGFGAALNSTNEMIIWAGGFVRSLEPKDVVMFESYTGGQRCKYEGHDHDTIGSPVGRCVAISYCNVLRKHVQVTDPAAAELKIKRFVRYNSGGANFPCSRCYTICSYTTLDGINLQYCTQCDKMLEKEHIDEDLLKKVKPPHKIMRDANRVIDVACVGVNVCMLLDNKKLVLRNYLTGEESIEDEEEEEEEEEENNGTEEDQIEKRELHKREALYGGGDNLWVKSDEGKLYKYDIEETDPGEPKMTEVLLPAAVKKVCCGSSVSAVLLADGSVWMLSDDCKPYRLYHDSGAGTFADIAVATMTNIFFVQANEAWVTRMKLPSGDEVLVNFTSDVDSSFLEMVKPFELNNSNRPILY